MCWLPFERLESSDIMLAVCLYVNSHCVTQVNRLDNCVRMQAADMNQAFEGTVSLQIWKAEWLTGQKADITVSIK